MRMSIMFLSICIMVMLEPRKSRWCFIFLHLNNFCFVGGAYFFLYALLYQYKIIKYALPCASLLSNRKKKKGLDYFSLMNLVLYKFLLTVLLPYKLYSKWKMEKLTESNMFWAVFHLQALCPTKFSHCFFPGLKL